MRKWNLIIMLMLILPIASALELCKESISPKEIPCLVISAWEYGNCSAENINIYDNTATLIQSETFSDYGSTLRCNITWNITEKGSYIWNVTNGDSGHLYVESEEDEMASLSVTLFIMAIAAAIFFIAFKVQFTKEEWSNFMIKRVLMVLGLFLMSLNTTIVVTMADATGLGVNKELFRYLWLINWTIYVSMVWLFWDGVTKGLKKWKVKQTKDRMGVLDGEA